MLQVFFHKKFEKSYRKLTPAMQMRVDERLEMFVLNLEDTRLRNHPLKGSRTGQWSIDISGDYRAVYEWYDADTVRFLDIDTHSELFGK